MKFITLTELDTQLPIQINAEQIIEIYANNYQSGSIIVYNGSATRLVKETVKEVMTKIYTFMTLSSHD